jgi:hypothetical protein
MRAGRPQIPAAVRSDDSIRASRIPLLTLPGHLHGRSLPPVVDNSENQYWPGIKDQYMFYTCQEYCGVTYTFGYEMNRLRDHPGPNPENTYPAHYTWNFLNNGQQYTGVNFLQAFDILKTQGHMTRDDYGGDSAYQSSGWPSGYDKYYRGMHNRIREVYAIPVNSTEGILTLKNYLYDHLDGSPTGGIACFTTDSWSFLYMQALPPGTPEAGIPVILSWQSQPVHGLTIVGYNDSIRYDLNEDGRYTNDLDINNDGTVDARDWEIGGFRVANSYGNWWSDAGFIYVLYSAMASDYEEGGVWNNRVYVVVPDSGYHPQLTMKLKMNYNFRDRIRIGAGVSTDPDSSIPEYTMEFPMFSFQGGEFPMQGSYAGCPVGADTIELGLDISLLLSHIEPGVPARFFLVLDESDPSGMGNGTIHQVSFLNYTANGSSEYPAAGSFVPVVNNGRTLISAVLGPAFSKPEITTPGLPPFEPGQTYAVPLSASGGRQPYSWSVAETYRIMEKQDSLGAPEGVALVQQSQFQPLASVPLPFPFPFYGISYDTLFVNFNGFASFDRQTVPYPYNTDELAMLEKFPLISPAFTQSYYYPAPPYGVWLRNSDPGSVTIQWKAAMFGGQSQAEANFGLRLFPDGRFDFLYGKMSNPNYPYPVFTGISKGDELNHNLEEFTGDADLSYQCVSYRPPQIPPGIRLSKEGLLVIPPPDSALIYEVGVRVTDAGNLSDIRYYELSDGLSVGYRLLPGSDALLRFGQPASLEVTLANLGQEIIRDLSLFLSTNTPGFLMADTLESLLQLNPGETVVLGNAFSFTLVEHLPNHTPVDMQIRVEAEADRWRRPLLMNVSAPEIETPQLTISDGDNSRLDPGEYAEVVIRLINTGEDGTTGLEAWFESLDSLVTIESQPLQVIDTFGGKSERILRYPISASRNTPPGHKASVRLSLSNEEEGQIIFGSEIQVGKKGVAITSLSTSSASLEAVSRELDSLHVPYDVFTSMPFVYNDYSAIFLLLGTGNSGSHVLTAGEGNDLSTYLFSAGNLYMEGMNTWNAANATTLHQLMQYRWERVSYFPFTGIRGVPGTFTDSLVITHHGMINANVYHFEPVGPAFSTLVSNTDPPRNVEVAFDGEYFHTIGTFAGFGYLADSLYPSGRRSLMKRYLDFFGIDVSGLHLLFHTTDTRACAGKPVTFTDDSYGGITARLWEFPGGNPASSTEISPQVAYGDSGSYDVALTITDGTNSRHVLKKQYVTVQDCTGADELPAISQVTVYPNPAGERLHVVLWQPDGGPAILELFDFTGKKCRELRTDLHSGISDIALSLVGLPKGIYLLVVTTPDFSRTVKIVTD